MLDHLAGFLVVVLVLGFTLYRIMIGIWPLADKIYNDVDAWWASRTAIN